MTRIFAIAQGAELRCGVSECQFPLGFIDNFGLAEVTEVRLRPGYRPIGDDQVWSQSERGVRAVLMVRRAHDGKPWSRLTREEHRVILGGELRGGTPPRVADAVLKTDEMRDPELPRPTVPAQVACPWCLAVQSIDAARLGVKAGLAAHWFDGQKALDEASRVAGYLQGVDPAVVAQEEDLLAEAPVPFTTRKTSHPNDPRGAR
ncbi:MAG: hypothetical protein NVS3B24_21290 [Candidatus Dormibacteria bacterium]